MAPSRNNYRYPKKAVNNQHERRYSILNCSADKLHRASFARRIAEMLVNAPINHSIVFGLSGPWGSGKTSMLNMVRESLEESALAPVIVNFNPWNYPSTSNLTDSFFKLISASLQKSSSTKNATKELTEILDTFSSYADALAPLVTLVPEVALVQSAFLILRNSRNRKKNREAHNVEMAKQKLSEALESSNLRIVVFIDDLDRLPSEGIRSVFQLIAAIADLPHVHYLIAYDRDNVIASLSEIQHCDGAQYLEKIIQVPIDLGIPTHAALGEILLEKLDALGSNILNDRTVAEEVSSICACVEPRLQTVREVNRLLNSLEVEWTRARGRIAFSDFLGITALRVLEPAIMPWIRANKSKLCGSPLNGVSFSEAENQERSITAEFEKILDRKPSEVNFVYKLLCVLFPRFSFACTAQYKLASNERLRLEGRIACPDIFDKYITGIIEAYDFPREEVQQLLDHGSVDDFVSLLINGQADATDTLLSIATSDAAQFQPQQLENIARAVIRTGASNTEFHTTLRIPYSRYDSCLNAICKVLGMNYSSMIIAEETDGLGFAPLAKLACFINGQELAYGRLAADAPAPEKQLISEKTLDEVEQHVVDILRSSNVTINELALDGAYTLLYLWRKFDPISYEDNVVNDVLSTALGYALFTCNWLGRYSSGDSAGWAAPNGFPDDVDVNRISECAHEAWKSKDYWTLPTSFQQKIAALAICADKVSSGAAGIYETEASDADVTKLLTKWEKQSSVF